MLNHAGDAAARPRVPIRTMLSPMIRTAPPGSPREASSPLHRVGEDSAEAQRHRVGAAARKRDLDRQSRRAEQPHRRRCLRAGERQDSVRLDPAQAEQAEEAEAPRHRPQRESNCVRPGGGPCPSARGISCTVTCWAPKDRRSSSIASRLLSLVEQEKMSMFTVPVSGHVWRTAWDSARMNTQVRPAPERRGIRRGRSSRRRGTAPHRRPQ